jgi:hypothetical protein
MTVDQDALAQYVVVERSITGTATIPDQDSLRGPPRPPLPISGASVVVTRDDGDSLVFAEIVDTLGVYRVDWTEAAGFLIQGREYRLRVTTPGGRTVRGRMRIPFAPVVTGLPPEGARFNRDRDTLAVGWSGALFSKGVYLQVRPRDVSKIVRMVLFTDSSTFLIPGRLPFPLPSDSMPPDVWIAGTRATLTVAAMDSNFFRFFRTGNDPFTGSGFANTLEGGLGVFGAMVPVNRTYSVVGDSDHPWEGRYRLTGDVQGISFDDTLTLFVTRNVPAPVLVGALADTADGLFAPRFEAMGSVANDTITLNVLVDPPGHQVRQVRSVFRGAFDPAGTTTGTIRNTSGEVRGGFLMRRIN